MEPAYYHPPLSSSTIPGWLPQLSSSTSLGKKWWRADFQGMDQPHLLGAPGAAWATTVACYASAVAAWVTVAKRPGGPWLPRFPRLLGAAVLGRSAGESKGAVWNNRGRVRKFQVSKNIKKTGKWRFKRVGHDRFAIRAGWIVVTWLDVTPKMQ